MPLENEIPISPMVEEMQQTRSLSTHFEIGSANMKQGTTYVLEPPRPDKAIASIFDLDLHPPYLIYVSVRPHFPVLSFNGGKGNTKDHIS